MSKLGPYFGPNGANPATRSLLVLWAPFGYLEDLSGFVDLYAYIGSMAPLPLEAPNSTRILVPTLASLSLAPQRGADVQRATCTSKRAGLTVQRAICTFMGEGHLVLGLQPISILVPRIWFHVPHPSNDQNMPKTTPFR